MDDETCQYGIQSAIEGLQAGRTECLDQLVELLREELKQVAHQRIASESRPPTVQTTDLLHEWYLKIRTTVTPLAVEDERHLINAASKAMRQILIDHARRRKRAKRGGGYSKIALDDILDKIAARGVDVLALHDAIEELGKDYPRHAQALILRYYWAYAINEIAQILDISPRTVYEYLAFARAQVRLTLDSESSIYGDHS